MSALPVAVITINFNGTKDTLALLNSLKKVKTHHRLSVYMVQVEADKQLKKLSGHRVEPIVIELEDNLGFTGANNVGMDRALSDGAEVIVLLNNDTTVAEDFLDPLVDAVQRKKIGLVSPKIYFYPNREFHRDSYTKKERGKVIWYAGGLLDWENVYAHHKGVDEVDHGQFNISEETGFATGCCIGVRAEVIKKVGNLNRDYFFGLEDLEWSMRVKEAGFKIWYQPDSVIWHKNAGSSGGSGSEVHQYYQTRNRLLFGMRYAAPITRLHMLKQAMGQLYSGTEDEKMGVRDYWLHRLGRRQ